jgi:ABC-2 type transport system permease protein
MKKIWTLIKREYKESVFKKSFIIITILTPFLMVALGLIPSLLLMMETDEPVRIHVVDQTNFVFPEFAKALNDTLKDGSAEYILKNIITKPDVIESVLNEQKQLVENESIDGVVYIPHTIIKEGKIQYFAKNVANFSINQRIKNSIGKIVTDHRIHQSGLDPAIINKLTKRLEMKTIKIVKGGEESERGFMEEYFTTLIFVLILYMTLILYGTAIMRSIVQEKTTRIIEILLSSTNPFQLMTGKIIGQGSVGLTQYLIWALFGIGLVLFGGNIMPASGDYFNFPASLFIYFVIYYILGYFVYAVLFAAIGAMTNSDQEAQQLSFPVIMLLIIPLLLIGFLVKNPDSPTIVVLSLIPFFSPIIMFARINLTAPSFLEIGGSILILLATIFFLIWIVSKIYRVGILMYGKRPTMPEIIRWVRYK